MLNTGSCAYLVMESLLTLHFKKKKTSEICRPQIHAFNIIAGKRKMDLVQHFLQLSKLIDD